jgi:hypothetical protein
MIERALFVSAAQPNNAAEIVVGAMVLGAAILSFWRYGRFYPAVTRFGLHPVPQTAHLVFEKPMTKSLQRWINDRPLLPVKSALRS